MSEETEELLAILRAKMEEQDNAKHEFSKTKTDLFYEPQANVAGHTAIVLGKLLFYVEARRSFLKADISVYKPSAANPRLLPARVMAETFGDRVDHYCKAYEDFHRNKIIYRVLLMTLQNEQ